MPNNVLWPRSMDVVFKMIDFFIQKGLATELVVRLLSIPMLFSFYIYLNVKSEASYSIENYEEKTVDLVFVLDRAKALMAVTSPLTCPRISPRQLRFSRFRNRQEPWCALQWLLHLLTK